MDMNESSSVIILKGVVHFKKKKLLLIIYSHPCYPRYPCLSFFSRKEIKVFNENIPELATKRFKVQKRVSVQTAKCSKGFKQFQTINKGLIKRNGLI